MTRVDARAVPALVALELLTPGESARSGGLNEEHVALLAESEDPLPPILVNRRGLRVVDGMHRVRAAMVRGQDSIRVEFFEGSDDEAFVRGVEANTAHGLPLSRSDRRAAAERIVARTPRLADREIARVVGLAASTVAAIRHRTGGVADQVDARVGGDGKVRPINGAPGRELAARVLAEQPRTTLREVARIAGISPATALDVRRRLEAGQEPLPKPVVSAKSLCLVSPPGLIVERLQRDPSLRHKEQGRRLLRLLLLNGIGAGEWSELLAAVPTHRAAEVARLARCYAESWQAFAATLDRPASDIPA